MKESMPTGSQVTIRPFVQEDVDTLVTHFNQTWSSDQDQETDISLLNARHFICHYLLTTTRGAVAELDGEFMGVTLLGVADQPTIYPQAQAQLDLVDSQLKSSRSGSQQLDSMLYWHQLEEAVERQAQVSQASQAELKLFLVSANARGHGVGRKLWCDMLTALALQGVERFFLHTDSSCDVSFYDHAGMDCIAKRMGADHPEDVDRRGDFYEDIYIYQARVDQQAAHWKLELPRQSHPLVENDRA